MISEAWNVGGPQVYETQLESPNDDTGNEPNKIYLTQLEETFDCDAYYPIKYLQSLNCEEQSQPRIEDGIKYTFKTLIIP